MSVSTQPPVIYFSVLFVLFIIPFSTKLFTTVSEKLHCSYIDTTLVTRVFNFGKR